MNYSTLRVEIVTRENRRGTSSTSASVFFNINVLIYNPGQMIWIRNHVWSICSKLTIMKWWMLKLILNYRRTAILGKPGCWWASSAIALTQEKVSTKHWPLMLFSLVSTIIHTSFIIIHKIDLDCFGKIMIQFPLCIHTCIVLTVLMSLSQRKQIGRLEIVLQ